MPANTTRTLFTAPGNPEPSQTPSPAPRRGGRTAVGFLPYHPPTPPALQAPLFVRIRRGFQHRKRFQVSRQLLAAKLSARGTQEPQARREGTQRHRPVQRACPGERCQKPPRFAAARLAPSISAWVCPHQQRFSSSIGGVSTLVLLSSPPVSLLEKHLSSRSPRCLSPVFALSSPCRATR